MRRHAGLVLMAVSAALLLTALPVSAAPVEGAPQARERDAVDLLLGAADAARTVDYRGTQRVASWSAAGTSSAVVPVRHQARTDPAGEVGLDPRRIALLAASYELAVVREGRCAGRRADVVEATRDDGTVAARFWVDRASGLLLRREVRAQDGRRLRGSAFVDVEISSAAAGPVPDDATALPDAGSVRDLRDDGWQVPAGLPGGFGLFETDLDTVDGGEQVLHLAYSDGLAHVSLFAQRGELGTQGLEGFSPDAVGERPVWVRHGDQERAVWSGGGHVWTLVSDATPAQVRDAVAALPRDQAPQDSLRDRLGRGMGRVASMLNPLD